MAESDKPAVQWTAPQPTGKKPRGRPRKLPPSLGPASIDANKQKAPDEAALPPLLRPSATPGANITGPVALLPHTSLPPSLAPESLLANAPKEPDAPALPAAIGPEARQQATKEDTFPHVAPARPAPDAFPGALGELQQAPLVSDNGAALSYETNAAAFEDQDRFGARPTSSKVGYASVKSIFRR